MKNYTKNTNAAIFILTTALLFLSSCQKTDLRSTPADAQAAKSNNGKAERASGSVATDWYRLQTNIMLERNSAFNGIFWSYIGVGLFESVRPGIRNSHSFYGQLRNMPKMPDPENNSGYNYVISANAALAQMTRLFFSGLTASNLAAIDALEKKYNESEEPGMGSAVFERSRAYGKAIADAVFSWYKTDDIILSSAGYIAPTGPGKWVPTPPALVNPPVNAYFGKATTMVASLNSASAKPFPYTYSEDPSSDFYKMVRQVYDLSLVLTDDQKQTARHWIDQGNGLGYTPPGHDFLVITQCLEQNGATLDIAAEAYAKAGVGERDGTIVTFRAKYENNLIRPVTYVRKLWNASWLPFIPTPPHPEYPAAHAGVTGSALLSAQSVIGDQAGLTDRAYDFRSFPPKVFSNLYAAVQDAGISRNYGGIHYLLSIDEGVDIARHVAGEVAKIRLRD